MGFTTSYWQKERWSRRAADTLTSYARCWNPSLGNWDANWRVGDQDCVRTAMKNHIKVTTPLYPRNAAVPVWPATGKFWYRLCGFVAWHCIPWCVLSTGPLPNGKKRRTTEPVLGLLFGTYIHPRMAESSRNEMVEGSKHHYKRLKTFSTTPESRVRDQGSEVQMPPATMRSPTPNAARSRSIPCSIGHCAIAAVVFLPWLRKRDAIAGNPGWCHPSWPS
jgi:hypothetical protein